MISMWTVSASKFNSGSTTSRVRIICRHLAGSSSVTVRPGLHGFATAAATSSPRQADIVLYKPKAGVPTAQRFVTNPFEGDGVEKNYDAGIIAGSRHTLHNGREDPDLNGIKTASIENRGFVLAQQPLSIDDWSDTEEVTRKWYPMIEDLAKQLTKSDRVIVASYVLRSVGAVQAEGVRGGAFMAHGDFNDKLKSQLLVSVPHRPRLGQKGNEGGRMGPLNRCSQ